MVAYRQNIIEKKITFIYTVSLNEMQKYAKKK